MEITEKMGVRPNFWGKRPRHRRKIGWSAYHFLACAGDVVRLTPFLGRTREDARCCINYDRGKICVSPVKIKPPINVDELR